MLAEKWVLHGYFLPPKRPLKKLPVEVTALLTAWLTVVATFLTACVMEFVAVLTALLTRFTTWLKAPLPLPDDTPPFEMLCVVVPFPVELPVGLVCWPTFRLCAWLPASGVRLERDWFGAGLTLATLARTVLALKQAGYDAWIRDAGFCRENLLAPSGIGAYRAANCRACDQKLAALGKRPVFCPA